MTRLEETREALMAALDAWYEDQRNMAEDVDLHNDLIDAYAALKRAENGEVDDDHT